MSEANLGSNPDASAIVPVKRKRGRPRKYPKLDRGVYFHGPRSLNPDHGGSRVPPGFLGVSENQPRQVDPVNDATGVMVGQTVHGVIEAAFDAGYLLTVRVSNSETTLRGVIFKPGHYIPVSTDNDVAPGVHMIRRNEVPFPRESYAQVHSHNSRSRERNGAIHTARVSNSVASKGKHVPSMATDVFSPANSRGNVVPVVLQPINISNGVAGESSSVVTQPDHAVASKGKQEPDDSRPLNGSTTTNQFHSQNNNQVTPSSIPSLAGSAQSLQEAEAKSMKLAGMPFEQLLAEVSKRNQVPAQSTETDTSSAGKLSTDDVNDVDQALSVEPLQAVQPDLNNHSAVASMPLENYRTGRMTELLQVLQEKIN
ncbi:protein METABOLIC NETWORK MODULATOR 1 isoform X2 [Mercurialis annua]|uniref:protein METABOLIC NETWORK MODULATOR 1 isoform X2 n=1 Tax=Mercurialis annua TaxID=3986 RepID=UPI00216091A8|nr:protein METABOLIC NETWORK MODULATOR 1 isoform X2 [Mercurialis annua]